MRKLSLFLLIFIFSCIPAKDQLPEVAVKKTAKIALVLGAGAAKGFAHIGVLKVLENNKIPIHMIVGTSAGSFVGSFYAYGFNAYQLQKIAIQINKTDIVDLVFPDNGFIQGQKIESYVNKMLNNTPIEKLKIPFYAVATDIQKGEEVAFGKGNTGMAVRASCSIPGVFTPVKIGNKVYVDGGVVSPIAVDAARKYGADIVIAVDVSADNESAPPKNTLETILQSINIMYAHLAVIQLSKSDIVIKPKVGYIASYDFEKRHEAILAGEKAAMEALPKINELISKLKAEGRI
jgi:NTE family protein